MKTSLLTHSVDVPAGKLFAVRGAVSSPIKVFHLPELGIDAKDFLARIAPTFLGLPLDPYDPALAAEGVVKQCLPEVYREHEADWLHFWNRLGELQFKNPGAGPQFWSKIISVPHVVEQINQLRPYRRRSCFQYLAKRHPNGYRWILDELGTPTFLQPVTDVRARPRRFAPPLPRVYQDPDVLRLIAMICQLVSQTASVVAQALRITFHQMLTYADSPVGSKPAPEGTHQDGSAFIVSALVIERQNVTGGISRVYYARDQGLALEYELKPGEGILQSDMHTHYWHAVSAIFPQDSTQPAYRSIIGLDIDFTDLPGINS